MAIQPESLWDTGFIKEMMERFHREERVMASFDYPMGTSTSSTYKPYGTYDKVSEKEKITEEEKVKEDLKNEPQFFDPKELDLDDNK